ncbi:hypothetical protein ACHHYP_12242, partial [Achlya hypogyna]
MYDGDDDLDMRNAISTLAELVEAEEFDTTVSEHVFMHPTEPRLVVGDLVAAQLAAHPPSNSFTLSTCNLNGLKRAGHLVASRLRTPTNCVLFQQTKLNNALQLELFHRHLTNEVGEGKYRLFVNDHRAHRTDSAPNRTSASTAPSTGKNALPSTPLDERLDASSHRPDLAQGQKACIEWLTALRVVDAWRLHHPSERVMSSPTGSNRIDYVFIDSDAVRQLYQSATYTKNGYGGDHLVHSVTLSAT